MDGFVGSFLLHCGTGMDKVTQCIIPVDTAAGGWIPLRLPSVDVCCHLPGKHLRLRFGLLGGNVQACNYNQLLTLLGFINY